jgi:glycerol-3-phosphate acyltransferase PlsY
VERLALAALVGYILGSIPTAYLVVRWNSQIDIRTAGSGNVGTLNAFEVTKSKAVAGIVLLVDFFKGLAAVVLAREAFGLAPDPGSLAALGAVVGHNFPVWLRGKGGRGLATAAGGALLTFWGVIPAWMAIWALTFALIRQVNPASAVACLLTLAIVLASPAMLPGGEGLGVLSPGGFTGLLISVILFRLIEPVRSYLYAMKRQRSG